MASTPEYPSLIQHLQSIDKTIDGHRLPRDNNLRREALKIAKSVVAKLEDPQEVVLHYGQERVWQQACLRLGIDLKLFHIIASKNGSPISADDLATEANAETLLIVRIMRVITTTGFAAEAGPQRYVQTALTKAITIPALEVTIKGQTDYALQISTQFPSYFATHGYACPTSPTSTPFQHVYQTRETFFQWLHSDPSRRRDVELRMEALRTSREHWTTWFPVSKNLLSGSNQDEDPESVLLVDVGGGAGEDIKKFLKKFPDAKGRVVLEDLPAVLEGVKGLDERIEMVGHDFFNEQPVKGARIYYTHHVLHNHPDSSALKILRHLHSAMTPHPPNSTPTPPTHTSTLILNESILPDTNCPALFAAADLNMMSILAGMKRSKQQWVELLVEAGFSREKVKVWDGGGAGEEDGVIEAGV